MRDPKWYDARLKEIYDVLLKDIYGVFDDAVNHSDLDMWEICLRHELHGCRDIIELAINEGMDSDIIDRFKELESQLECYIRKQWS